MSPRIDALSNDRAPTDSAKILQQVQAAVGMTPNLHRTVAHSPSALKGYVDFAGALAGGALAPPLRESLAIALAGKHGCEYCASAHTAIGASQKIPQEELTRNLAGESSDPRTAAALTFALAVREHVGNVSDADLAAVRDAGFSEAEVVELVAHVGLNTYTNTFNNLARTAIDFPRVPLKSAVG